MRKILLLFCLIFSTAVTAQDKEFSLTGKTADIEDGTYLYFRDLVNGGNLDSAVVRNNSFKFTTELPEPTLFVMLFTKDRKNFTELWLENNPMTFDASSGNFKEAKVTGSRNHSLFKKANEELYSNFEERDKEEIKKQERQFVESHPEALVSVFILHGNQRWTQAEVGEVFSNFSEEVQNSSLGQRITGYLEKDLPEPGETYADFKLPNYEGEITSISDLKGKEKLTLLQFWSSGCGSSRKMNTNLSELYNEYHSDGFQIITISDDTSREAWLQAIKQDKVSWPKRYNLQNSDGQIFKDYGVYSTPSNFLIDGEGIIIARNLRGDELEKEITEKLAD